ncbi:MAG: helix-turn-helix domain-containing protein [Treponema sp.]|nr:helix-turn-helix domain-containing protein [Treponema sp.]
MESYGDILRQVREDKGLTVTEVAKATSISESYIKALETEDVQAFPGETYLIGFLRNYSNYLGADTESLIKYYNAAQRQASPVPKELLEKHAPKFVVPLIITIFAILLVSFGFFMYFYVLKVPARQAEKAQKALESTKIHQYEFSGEIQNVRLYTGDQILIPSADGQGNVVLTVADTKGALAILTPYGRQVIELSEERGIDVNNDNAPEIILYVSDVDVKDGSRGAEVRMLSVGSGYVSFVDVEKTADAVEETKADEIPVRVESNGADGATKRTVIKEDTRAYPFTVNITFRGSCVLRYRSDRKDTVEGYYTTGDTVTVSSQNGFRIWSSNINVMKIQVIAGLGTYDISVGKAGEVEVEDIKWVRDSDGMYRLVVEKLD